MQRDYIIQYRPEIDGLRAFAVIAVMIYHIFPDMLKGGFLGVDVFFVISGYLMTGVIVRESEAQTFSLIRFYHRRLLRIVPVLFLVLSIVLGMGWILFFDNEMLIVGQTLAGGALFIANWIFLANSANYFNSTLGPFTHLWSLSIEEQFYIVYPLILVFLIRMKKKPLTFITILTIISLGLFIYYQQRSPVIAFYSTPTRLWELLAGGIVYFLRQPDRNFKYYSAGGLILILSSFAFLSERKFIGKEIIPVAGAVMILLSSSITFTNRRILSTRILVMIGLMSYSLYLWHIPVGLFIRLIYAEKLPILLKLFVVIVTFVLSWTTWKWWEEKWRYKNSGTVWLICLVILGVFAHLIQDESQLFKVNPIKISPLTSRDKFHDCGEETEYKAQNVFCYRTTNKKPEFLLLGDSHAWDKHYGISNLDKDRGWLVLYGQSCPPVIGYSVKACKTDMEKLINWAASEKEMKTVVIGFGSFYRDHSGLFLDGLRKTLRIFRLSGKKIVLLMDTPRSPVRLFDCVRKTDSCSFNYDSRFKYNSHRAIFPILKKEFPGIQVFDPLSLFCSLKKCSILKDGRILFSDQTHLSKAGSLYYAENFLKEIRL